MGTRCGWDWYAIQGRVGRGWIGLLVAAEVVVAEVVLHAVAMGFVESLFLKVADKELETLTDILAFEYGLFDRIVSGEKESGGVCKGFGFLDGFHVMDYCVDFGVIAFGVNGPDESQDVTTEPFSRGVGDWGGSEQADIQNRVKVGAPTMDGHSCNSFQYEVGCPIGMGLACFDETRRGNGGKGVPFFF